MAVNGPAGQLVAAVALVLPALLAVLVLLLLLLLVSEEEPLASEEVDGVEEESVEPEFPPSLPSPEPEPVSTELLEDLPLSVR